ncbi:hypothetical protein HDV01_004232 [Terramyces sp. JEL0728]|nr:hypothetical protein HDV01_004232 [Terramyces sp. JEL0728]
MDQELKLFQRLMYKNKNQFRHFIQYKKLELISRIYKKYQANPSDQLLLLGIKSLLKAYCWLRLLCRQTYFMPFTLSMMAITSRLMHYSKELINIDNIDVNDIDLVRNINLSIGGSEMADMLPVDVDILPVKDIDIIPDRIQEIVPGVPPENANDKPILGKSKKKKVDPALDFFGKKSEIDDIFGDF